MPVTPLVWSPKRVTSVPPLFQLSVLINRMNLTFARPRKTRPASIFRSVNRLDFHENSPTPPLLHSKQYIKTQSRKLVFNAKIYLTGWRSYHSMTDHIALRYKLAMCGDKEFKCVVEWRR